MAGNNTSQENKIVFISYASEDYDAAKKVYDDLTGAGVNVWLDKVSLIAGQNWKIEIKNSIKRSGYFIAILSSTSIKKRGYVQKEFKYALEVFDEIPAGEIFAIPVRLDDCEIPYDKLKDIQYVDLFPNWQDGINRIHQALRIKPSVSGKTKKAVTTIPDAYVNDLKKKVMKKLIEMTDKDETASTNKDDIYKEACEGTSVIGSYNHANITLKNRVFQDLFGEGSIVEGDNRNEVKITYQGKRKPEYQL